MTKSKFTRFEVKKHVGAIHIDGQYSLLQRKIANALLWNAYDNLLEQDRHQIKIKDLALIVGFDSNDIGLLKNAFRSLAKISLEWNLLDDDGQEEWGIASMLSQAVIRGGRCIYAYAPDLKEKLYNPDIYARINLSIQRKINSGYALALYENCSRYRNVGSTGWVQIDVFRSIMGVSDSDYYKSFKNLNSKVIKPSLKAINASTDIKLEIELKRKGRRIDFIRFTVEENEQSCMFLEEPSEPVINPLITEMMARGLSGRSANNLLSIYGESRVKSNIKFSEKEFKAGKVDNLPAYITSAIKMDYAGPQRLSPNKHH